LPETKSPSPLFDQTGFSKKPDAQSQAGIQGQVATKNRHIGMQKLKGGHPPFRSGLVGEI
jgi:hypothetical protein